MLLAKIKLYDIAKELGLASKEVVEIAQKLQIDVKSYLSSVEEVEAKKIREAVNNKNTAKKDAPKKENKKPITEKNDTPVIIRREVIITDENKTPKDEVKKEEKKNNNVGFVERKHNKDYNIVYRNKPSKPMTVDELFGIKKEEKVAVKEDKMEVTEKEENKSDSVVKTETKIEIKQEVNTELKTEQ